MIRRYEILGFECSILEAQKLAWFLSGAMWHAGGPGPLADDFVANRYGPYSDKIRHLLDSLDGSYLTCEKRVADARPLDPIRFRYDRQDRIAVYLTTPEARAYRPALEAATAIIDGFQSPYGLELLATIDWLHREVRTPMEVAPMMAAIARWPGPQGSAERKAQVFSERHVGIAIEHLRAVAAAEPVT
jgi:hypothetical protein